MLLSKLKTAGILLFALIGSTVLAWHTIAAWDDDKAHHAHKLERQTDAPKVKDAIPRHTRSAAERKRPFTATIEVRDLTTNAAIRDAQIECAYEGPKSRVRGGENVGDDRLPGERPHTVPDLGGSWYFNVTASRAGFVPLVISWSQNPRSPEPPDPFRFQMEKAVTIGGRVLDQDQRPVAGATVVIKGAKSGYADSEQKPDVFFVPTKTDADGRWSFSNTPEQSDAVAIGCYHHLYLSDQPFFQMDDFQPVSALRDRSAVLRLRSGTRIDGTVVGPDGRPVPDATVLYGAESFAP